MKKITSEIKANRLRSGIDAKTRMFRLGIRGVTVARELRRSSAAVSRAISEGRPVLLGRIHHYLDRIERDRSEVGR
jgi:hypothetical protein